MTENRRFYHLKLKENFYNSETMVILESMQDGLLYSNLLLKMYLMSLKSSGVLLLNDCLPHTVQTIATFTRHQVGTVERALKIFQEFGLVEILTDGAHAYGRYRNVFLSSAELAELQTELPALWEQYIERLSEYMESSGKGYKNHAATIRRWANADKKKEEAPAWNRDYSVEEGETV